MQSVMSTTTAALTYFPLSLSLSFPLSPAWLWGELACQRCNYLWFLLDCVWVWVAMAWLEQIKDDRAHIFIWSQR